MITTVPQLGHFPFLPAAASGVRTCWRQVGQGNSIGIGSVEGIEVGRRRQRWVFARQERILIRLQNDCSGSWQIPSPLQPVPCLLSSVFFLLLSWWSDKRS
jgi:hypothetical protein